MQTEEEKATASPPEAPSEPERQPVPDEASQEDTTAPLTTQTEIEAPATPPADVDSTDATPVLSNRSPERQEPSVEEAPSQEDTTPPTMSPLTIQITEPSEIEAPSTPPLDEDFSDDTPTLSNVSSSFSPGTQQVAVDLLEQVEQQHLEQPIMMPGRTTSMGDDQPMDSSSHKQSRNEDNTASQTRKPRVPRAPQPKSSDVNWNVKRKSSKLELSKPSAVPPPQEEQQQEPRPVVAVFNANTNEGGSMVRALSRSGGQDVVAIVRVFTSKNTKRLLKLPNVSVKVADSHDEAALSHAVQGAQRAFLVTKYWETFDSWLEESQANLIVRACGNSGVEHLVLSSVEDTKRLKEKGGKSQIVPDKNGVIHPKFEGMRNLRQDARERGVLLTHMLTSYVDQETSKQSVALIMSDRGKLIVAPN